MPRINDLWKLREWLMTDEAATYLSSKTGNHIAEEAVFRLALDGHLALSVHFPASVEAMCQEGGGPERPERRKRIEGLWELPMDGAGRIEAESRYHSLRGLPYVHVDGRTGASVTRDGVVCRVTPHPGSLGISPTASSAIPWGSVIVVRVEDLDAFAARLPAAVADVPVDALGKPLGERERATLLTIVAVLAEAAGIDVSKPSKAGAAIEAMTLAKGVKVSGRTVEDHLKRIPEALERRRKLADD